MNEYCRIDACLLCRDTLYEAMVCGSTSCLLRRQSIKNVCYICNGFSARYFGGCHNLKAIKNTAWEQYWTPPDTHRGHNKGYLTSDDVERAFSHA